MKKFVAFFLVAAALTVSAFAKDIVILTTNDTHCAIENDHGFAGVTAYRDAMAEDSHVALVDAGDFVQGDAVGALSKGQYIIDIMNAVGYDVVTLGNHEFDYQVPQMLLLMEQLTAEKVSSNFMDLSTGESVFAPYTILTFDGVDVAFVGITTPESFTKTTPAYFQDEAGNYIYGFCEGNDGQDLYDNIQSSIDRALAEGADYVIALAHLGIEEDAAPWRSTDVIANTTGLDVLIDGHSHTVSAGETVDNLDGEPVLTVQTGEKFNNIGKVVIGEDGSVTVNLVSTQEFDQKDEIVQALVDEINGKLAVELEQVVASSQVALIANDAVTGAEIIRCQETNLGDLVADAYRTIIGADVAICNGGGIRADIAAGDITYADIIAVNPWGNNAASVRVTGQVLLDALELGVAYAPGVSGGFLQVSGMAYTVDLSIPSSVVVDDRGSFVSVDGEYRVVEVTVGDKPLDLEAYYVVGSHDYLLLSGGDGMTMFQGAEVVKDRFMVDNEVLIAYMVDYLGGDIDQAYGDINGQGRITMLESGGATTYVVTAGDSLWSIAATLLGDGSRWVDIYNANDIATADLILVGAVLEIPG
ncbi:MAG: 5'-nucleotidase C-terminal domain-containing protein [Eubacteriales bacterium]